MLEFTISFFKKEFLSSDTTTMPHMQHQVTHSYKSMPLISVFHELYLNRAYDSLFCSFFNYDLYYNDRKTPKTWKRIAIITIVRTSQWFPWNLTSNDIRTYPYFCYDSYEQTNKNNPPKRIQKWFNLSVVNKDAWMDRWKSHPSMYNTCKFTGTNEYCSSILYLSRCRYKFSC